MINKNFVGLLMSSRTTSLVMFFNIMMFVYFKIVMRTEDAV